MESTSSGTRIIYCPLCKEGLQELTTFNEDTKSNSCFVCESQAHCAPYVVIEQVSDKNKEHGSVVVFSSTDEVLTRERKTYCFLCGSELRHTVTYTTSSTPDGTTVPVLFSFYECVKNGHIWHVVDEIKQMIFVSFLLADFDGLLQSCGTVSRHHIVIPLHRTKRYMRMQYFME